MGYCNNWSSDCCDDSIENIIANKNGCASCINKTMEEEPYIESQKRNKANVKKKENKKYPYKHSRCNGRISINDKNNGK